MVSVLTRMLGVDQIDVAEDIVQDTLLKAMRLWSMQGIPANPPAWLYTVAKNKAIDFIRAKKSQVAAARKYSSSDMVEPEVDPFQENEIQDSVLCMIFACCHPAIPEESGVAMSLKILGGLSVQEIAKAYLTSEETVAKRIYRAKEKIRMDNIPLHVPSPDAMPARLDNVLRVLYLMFNEGYHSSQPNEIIRKDLCAEAMRLTHVLTQHRSSNRPSVNALLALMCFQSCRLLARTDDQGNIITLKYQDRSKWNKPLILKGRDYLDRAAEGPVISLYHIEAAIAGLHASAPTFEQTDWLSVHDLYTTLYQLNPSPIVALNKAIASSYAISNESALELLKQIKGLEKYHLYHAALGEVRLSLGEFAKAKEHFEDAFNLTQSAAERQLLQHKMELCTK